jgi:NAD(P)-dependent dehydrogenase (short-subunit alcohol dehydrogenase family)
MDIAIVTGASSSLGLAISKRLIQMGFRVYGLGGDYTDCSLQNVNFKPFPCDLANPEAVEAAAQSILEKEKGVFVLINNAKYYGKKAFFEADRQEIERVLNINLLCPLVLTRALADSLVSLQGFLIQLGSPYAETSRGGPVGAAASGGLKWMGEVLFHDLRDHGVKVCHLSPEPNRGRDPRTMVRPGARIESAIDPEAVAQAVEQILQSSFGNIVTEMVLRPLRVSEPEHDPVVRLPYPKPKPVPYTVPREMIEAEEQLETEEYDRKENLRRKKRQAKQAEEPKREPKSEPKKEPKREESEKKETDSETKDSENREPSRRPRRSRKPRSARKQATEKEQPETAQKVDKPVERSKPQSRPEKKDPPREEKKPEPQPEQASESRRRRSRRKPRPPMTSVGFLNRNKEQAPPKQDIPEKKPDAKPEPKPEAKTSPAEDRKPAKKAPKKAARKSAPAKKAATKAAPAKKAAPRKRTAKKAASKDASKSD